MSVNHPMEGRSKSKDATFLGPAKILLPLLAIVYGYFSLAVYLHHMDLWSFQLQFLEKPSLVLPLGIVGLIIIFSLGCVFAVPAVPHSLYSRSEYNKTLSYILAPKMIFIPILLWLAYLYIIYFLQNTFSTLGTETFCATFLTGLFTLLQLIVAFSNGITMEITRLSYETYSGQDRKKAIAGLFIRTYISNLFIGLYSFLLPVLLTKNSQLGSAIALSEPIRLVALLVVVLCVFLSAYVFVISKSGNFFKKSVLFFAALIPLIYVLTFILPRQMLVLSSMALGQIGLSGGTHVYEWIPPSWEEERRVLNRLNREDITRVGPNRYTFCAYNVMRFDKQIALCITEKCRAASGKNKIVDAYEDVQQFGPLVLNLDGLRMVKATCARE